MSMFYQVKTVVSGYLAVGSKRATPYFLRSKDSTRLTEKVALQESPLQLNHSNAKSTFTSIMF